MKSLFSKKFIIAVFCVVALGAGLFAFFALQKNNVPESVSIITTPLELKVESPERKVLGLSVEGREIESYKFGKGKTQLIFVGGIHGGYEWNSVILAYEFMDYLKANLEFIPENLSITVIPSLNPDGVFKIIGKEGRFTVADVPAGSNGAGRLNAHAVDLNRNFDCKWKPKGLWGTKEVSCGSRPFSEPESMAIRKFVLENNPTAVIFWHSKSNGVYASYCEADILQETRDIMNTYSKVSGYPAYETFDQYEVTGDASDWLASIGIPAISVELKTHETIEWEQNLAGIQALFKYYENKN
ncbi:MAG: M14 family metallopeptidase [Candidatus Nealsonbacteria bacterium]|nr:M14 family metallopeptidase [Candidatus Nealsonbacteria bacterium]